MSSPVPARRKIIAERLIAAREQAGYPSAKAFCERHNHSLEQYRQHEAGEKPLKLLNALHYGKHLNVSVRWLLIGEK